MVLRGDWSTLRDAGEVRRAGRCATILGAYSELFIVPCVKALPRTTSRGVFPRLQRMAPKKAVAGKKKEAKKEKEMDGEALRAAFAQFDLDGDGAISREELITVLTRPTGKVGGEPFSAADAATEAEKIVKMFDKNGDAKLQYDEFVTWLIGGSKASTTAVPEPHSKAAAEENARLLQEKIDEVFAKYDKGAKGGLKKVELAQIVKDANEDYGFLDDLTLPGFIKQAWIDAAPDAENLCRIEQFRTW